MAGQDGQDGQDAGLAGPAAGRGCRLTELFTHRNPIVYALTNNCTLNYTRGYNLHPVYWVQSGNNLMKYSCR